MKKTKNLLTIVAMMLLVAMLSVGGTLAWLTATNEEDVVNTFTVGDIVIDIWEYEVTTEGTTVTEGTEETKKNTYNVIPGATVPKTPYVEVKANSQNCWVYVYVENNVIVDGYVEEDGTIVDNKAVASWTLSEKWTELEKVVDDATGVEMYLYKYNTEMKYATEDKDTDPVFEEVKIDSGVTENNLSQIGKTTIELKAYAHQADTVSTSDADAAAIAWFNALVAANN